VAGRRPGKRGHVGGIQRGGGGVVVSPADASGWVKGRERRGVLVEWSGGVGKTGNGSVNGVNSNVGCKMLYRMIRRF
jgi:hypothetical protein